MDLSLRAGAALIGLLVIVAFFRSVLQVAVVNRQRGDWLARRVGWLVYTTLARRALKRQSYADVQDVLAWVLPLYILLLIVVWFGLVQAGFSLLIWSPQAEHSFLQALIASGSALSTLGFLTPPGIAGQLLAILEGAMGLGIIVFYFTFILGYQTTIQLRQVKVAWLYARAGPGLTNFTLVEWFLLSGASDWSELWEDWESWFRNLAETHALAPILAFVPTVHRGQTWLAAAAVALEFGFVLSVRARGARDAVGDRVPSHRRRRLASDCSRVGRSPGRRARDARRATPRAFRFGYGVRTGDMLPENASALVGAAVITVAVFPPVAILLRSKSAETRPDGAVAIATHRLAGLASAQLSRFIVFISQKTWGKR